MDRIPLGKVGDAHVLIYKGQETGDCIAVAGTPTPTLPTPQLRMKASILGDI